MRSNKIRPEPATAKTVASTLVRDIVNEAWICKRLGLPELFAGVTSTEIRRDRLKVVLIERELTESVAGRADGKPVKWRDLFKQLYHVDLS
jgi:hypothetical protein